MPQGQVIPTVNQHQWRLCPIRATFNKAPVVSRCEVTLTVAVQEWHQAATLAHLGKIAPVFLLYFIPTPYV